MRSPRTGREKKMTAMAQRLGGVDKKLDSIFPVLTQTGRSG